MLYLKSICCLLFTILLLDISAQTSVKADRMYQDLAYKEAINLFETKNDLSVEDMLKIANSYRLNHDTQNAALWFEQIIEDTDDPINYLYYAQALQSNGNYEKAKKYFLRYNEVLGRDAADQRGNQLAAAIDRMNDWKSEEDIVLKEAQAINSENLDFSPTYYNNGIVFVSSRKLSDDKKYKWTGDHFMNLYYAATDDEGELTSVKSFSKMINSKYHEGPVAFSKNFDRIFFTRNDHLKGKVKANKNGVVKLGIFTALKDGENWTEPRAVDFNTTEHEECHPSLSADGKYLYFSSDRPDGQGGMDIYVSEFVGGKWSEPTNLGSQVNTPGNDVFPFVHDDGTLYFASDGWGGLGGLDIFESSKNENQQWSEASNLGHPYNSRKDDFGFVMNVLGTEGYLNSSRDGGTGKDDIYSFKRDIASLEKPTLSTKIPSTNGDITIYQFIYNESKGQNELRKIQEKVIIKEAPKPIIEKEKKKIIFNAPAPVVEKVEEKVVVEAPIIVAPAPVVESPVIVPPVIASPNIDNLIEKDRLIVGESFVLQNVYYDFDKQKPLKEGYLELDRLVQFMKENPNMEIELSSHTDSRGRNKYNRWLSRKRAENAVQYITGQGISNSRLTAKGYGETKLKNKCADGVDCEEHHHLLNRRTEIKILNL